LVGDAGVVATRHGRVRGVERDGIWQFLGLRYAAPTGGANRFRPPQPLEPWSGVRDAGEYGPIAPQPVAAFGYVPNDPTDQDEDCCTLNVYTPACDGGRRPVMAFLHGGAFTSGTGSSATYRGAALVRRDVVLVTIDHRLGALGFLAHPCLALPGEAGIGNWGLLDQVAALGWIREHVASFGGDPDRVTVFGESGGAMSVADLLGAPAARGLFSRAILQSGAALATSQAVAGAIAEELAGQLGIAEVSRAALEAVPVSELIAAQCAVSARIDRGIGMPFQPVVDGGFLPRHPAAAVAAGAASGIELLAGTNRDEFRLFSYSLPELDQLTDESAERIVGAYLAGSGVSPGRLEPAAVVESYRWARLERGDEAAPRDLVEAVAADWIFRLPVLRLLDAQRARGGRAFCYLFDWESPFGGGALRSCHGLELPFVFGTLTHPVIGAFAGRSEEALHLSDCMVAAWTAFATTGDPSCAEVGPWPAYEAPRRATMVLGRDIHLEDAPYEAERSFLDAELGRYGMSGPIEGAEPPGVAVLLEATSTLGAASAAGSGGTAEAALASTVSAGRGGGAGTGT